MNRSLKLVLDVLLGAVVPILVLAYLSEPLGAVPAYLISALVPVGWVAADLLFITRRLNFITTFLGLSALVRGLLAFWFVDGFLFALKDSAGSAVTVAVFGGSLLLGRPALRAFAQQSLDPRTPRQGAALAKLFAERPVARVLFLGTASLAAVHAVAGIANFLLNFSIVVAPFGTAEFNTQVATVNAVTRVALGVPEVVATGLAIWLVFKAIYSRLPDVPGETDVWKLIQLREERGAPDDSQASDTPPSVTHQPGKG
ncbi:MAG: hypothetical protein AVDCRST_MAG25-3686 [uncultured Rubrobacteraceae bacterium]|uniref:Transmembrane protein n=1 Tax=uncultured Rubrobacteraceae bacterium TaxID=349277 RepID=A0A6J4SEJ6_9ACTN|nr:MAG: hypothetical protein AVDCRST_MAG25-3686 [uncultured Rubrobacteraceae bacterium]